MTTVVNIHTHKYDIYIGRYSHSIGPWGNRYTHKRSSVPGVIHVATLGEAIQRHKQEVRSNPELMKKIKKELRDKVLGCHCHEGRPLPWAYIGTDRG